MPYIDADARKSLIGRLAKNAGELNYRITGLCLDYLYGEVLPRYADFNEVIGVLECVKLEMYRRAVAPYEDTKMRQNGDVYPSGE